MAEDISQKRAPGGLRLALLLGMVIVQLAGLVGLGPRLAQLCLPPPDQLHADKVTTSGKAWSGSDLTSVGIVSNDHSAGLALRAVGASHSGKVWVGCFVYGNLHHVRHCIPRAPIKPGVPHKVFIPLTPLIVNPRPFCMDRHWLKKGLPFLEISRLVHWPVT
jgi:hypothetical protein